MSFLKRNDGIFIFETALVIQLVFGVLFWSHIEIVKLWRKKMEKLQTERIPYDGVTQWKK